MSRLTSQTNNQFHRKINVNQPCKSVLGGCDRDHGWRHRGGFHQVSGSHVFGRLQPAWERAPPEGHQQVAKAKNICTPTLDLTLYQRLGCQRYVVYVWSIIVIMTVIALVLNCNSMIVPYQHWHNGCR